MAYTKRITFVLEHFAAKCSLAKTRLWPNKEPVFTCVLTLDPLIKNGATLSVLFSVYYFCNIRHAVYKTELYINR